MLDKVHLSPTSQNRGEVGLIDKVLAGVTSKTTRNQMQYLLERVGEKVKIEDFKDEFKLKTDVVIERLISIFEEKGYTLQREGEDMVLVERESDAQPVRVNKIVDDTNGQVSRVTEKTKFLSYAETDLKQIPGVRWSNVDNYIIDGEKVDRDLMDVFLFFVSKFPEKVSKQEIRAMYGEKYLLYLKTKVGELNKLLEKNYATRIHDQDGYYYLADISDKSFRPIIFLDQNFGISDAFGVIKCNGKYIPLTNEHQVRGLKKILTTKDGIIPESDLGGRTTAKIFAETLNTFFTINKVNLKAQRFSGSHFDGHFNHVGNFFKISKN